ncbi:MAG TPA: hypothetical protein VME22_10195 [Solirubrobacteraceae bacterium]|nr:hypothetical protein [Solirubrobacteraceae bacterium]
MSSYDIDDTAPAATEYGELIDCPTCGSPAEIIDRFVLGGAPGPVEHVKIACVRRHWYTLPVDDPALTRSAEEADHSNSARAYQSVSSLTPGTAKKYPPPTGEM